MIDHNDDDHDDGDKNNSRPWAAQMSSEEGEYWGGRLGKEQQKRRFEE